MLHKVQKLRRFWESACADERKAGVRHRPGEAPGQRFFDDYRAALKAGEAGPEDLGIRALFENFVPNGREIVDSWNPQHGDGGVSVRLIEDSGGVGMSAFRVITTDIMTQKALDRWNAPEWIADKLVTPYNTTLEQETFPGVSTIGEAAEEVPEFGEYPTSELTEDWVRGPRTKKYGRMIKLSKEIVFHDQLGRVMQEASNIIDSLRLSKENRVLDVVTGVVNPYQRQDQAADTYQATENLITSNGLTNWKSIEQGLIYFANTVDPNTGLPVLVRPTSIVVPSELEMTALRIMGAFQQREATDSAATTELGNNLLPQLKVLTSPRVYDRSASTTTWWMGDFKKALIYVQNWPFQVVQQPPNSDDEFKYDVVASWKASEKGAVGVLERLQVQKHTA